MFEKMSQSLKYDSNFFLSTNIYIYTYIHMDTNTDHSTLLASLYPARLRERVMKEGMNE